MKSVQQKALRMTPSEEFALIKACCPFEGFMPRWEDIRLAIRAAYDKGRSDGKAQERERAASCADAEASIEGIAQRIAAAIRRGE